MYLKSIEMHGFKSFANKIVLDFHNGITGIVGPNGSGKSNVGDAVRWVLGEQSAKQLRGASMQDVIFAGTENRKPVSFAYVAITMDNSDHVLPVSYDEVTVARRVYRSGESEYLLNGTVCRLKDVNELFYDTGIGKEGYSIIGQGQIERILSGKPEDRRELFDEAVGIVKFKKRKSVAQKKLAEEQDNLVRVNDILGELENRVGPLEEQAKTARKFLELKDRQKKLDVNLFLIEMVSLEQEKTAIAENYSVADRELSDAKAENERINKEYEAMETRLAEMEEKITFIRDEEQNAALTKSKLENEIRLLEEQIRSGEATQENYQEREAEIDAEIAADEKEAGRYEAEQKELSEQLAKAQSGYDEARAYFQGIQDEIARCNASIEANNKEHLKLLEERSDVTADEERLKALEEQISIRRASLNQRLLARKTEADQYAERVEEAKREYEAAAEEHERLLTVAKELEDKAEEWKQKRKEASIQLNNKESELNKAQSRYESIRNIAERYEGYGNAVKRVMEQKTSESGLVGVVADLIHVPKKYETAIETALGGSIQNIVTEDEDTAKRMISFLKQNHAGRATFLPLTSVDGRKNARKPDVGGERGVLGLASELLEYDARYEGIISHLIGRVVVADHIDNAVALARKNHYSLNIVTLEGEYLRPGGSLSGGAYKHAGNLLSRNRQMEEMEQAIVALQKESGQLAKRLDEIDTAAALLEDDQKENADSLQEAALAENTAKLKLEQTREGLQKSQQMDGSLQEEGRSMESELLGIRSRKEENGARLKEIADLQQKLADSNDKLQKTLDEQTYMESTAARNMSEIEMEGSSAKQRASFLEENLTRIRAELAKHKEAKEKLLLQVEDAKADVAAKTSQIDEIQKTIIAADESKEKLGTDLSEALSEKEKLDAEYKGFFERKEEVANQINNLEKEILRLDTQKEKTDEAISFRNNYMWEEYELTRHAAMELEDESLTDDRDMRRELDQIKSEIRGMGPVNAGAIEEYAETKERYDFLKSQHDDIIEAQEQLSGIIDELDEGMRKQFEEGFREIQKEFDSVFKQLFGGGKGTLELIPDEDILETGIRIIAQPPGKKLQNMMQLSGGEKSLTAISLLFAIQNLKPSPFCLLDEIEAALDDSNVGRFAKYLHKLTENTQFIVITHRRGTMNAADRLYGITMQEKGISTLVSVNLIEDDLDE